MRSAQRPSASAALHAAAAKIVSLWAAERSTARIGIVFDRPGAERLVERGELVRAFDMQRDRARAQQDAAGERQTRLRRAGGADRRDQRARRRVHRLGEALGAGEPRGGMAVVAHAERDDIGGQGQVGDARVGGGEFLVFVEPRIGERDERGLGGATLEQPLAHQPGVGARRIVGDASLVGERHRDARPVDRPLRQRVEEAQRRAAAGDDQQRRAARGDRHGEPLGGPVGESGRERRAVGEVAAGKSRHSYSSFQARPSRSIGAIDAAGPLAPAEPETTRSKGSTLTIRGAIAGLAAV